LAAAAAEQTSLITSWFVALVAMPKKEIEQQRSGRMARESLKQARKDKGMTQQAVADYVPMDVGYYKKIESGERLGSIAIWDKLEDLFSIHQRELRLVA